MGNQPLRQGSFRSSLEHEKITKRTILSVTLVLQLEFENSKQTALSSDRQPSVNAMPSERTDPDIVRNSYLEHATENTPWKAVSFSWQKRLTFLLKYTSILSPTCSRNALYLVPTRFHGYVWRSRGNTSLVTSRTFLVITRLRPYWTS